MELDLEIFWHTDDTKLLEEMEMEVDYSECETRIFTFYTIDHIWEAVGGFCGIMSSGCEYVVNDSVKNIKKKIRKSKLQIFNQ